ncbi:heparinase II/III family protein [Kordiimonas sp. SCSIO 12610]|uniref:heparinase II/III family protein n=1 Tax=Kordiimonas sp. SCSIO 12610 TaxID=2829597 RepID=UPI00210E164E|nr:heparinase II/III family protein [Kordiimonas sp. SCSIO 12610]UTW55562.1 heparinase II/III family protein [Kordiimonas sp. SCSIO 12610]
MDNSSVPEQAKRTMTAAYNEISVSPQNSPAQSKTLKRADKHANSSTLKFAGRMVREWGYSNDLYKHRLSGRHPVQLLASPDDPAPGNATLGSALLGGDMLFGNDSLSINERFWTRLDEKNTSFFSYGHRFHWLQDLAQVKDQQQARETGEFLTRRWLDLYGTTWRGDTWNAEILSRRLINWLAHAPLILSSSDLVYRSTVLLSMARQARHLLRAQNDTDIGLPQIYTASALTLSGLLLPGGSAWFTRGIKTLEAIIQAFILPDGGPASRNPSDIIKSIQTLILVRNAFRDVQKDQPVWLQPAIDRMVPFIKAMRHENGNLCHFSGSSAEGGHGTDAVLAVSEAKGKALDSASHTGYQRLKAGNGCLIVDAGPPPAQDISMSAHASTSAFEFSSGSEHIIVNMGSAATHGPIPELQKMCRTTAAHSTLIIADRNSTKINEDGSLGKGVNEVSFKREYVDGSAKLDIEHDGYLSRFGVTHSRSLTLRHDGLKLSGIDSLDGVDRRRLNGAEALIRFHLHPSVTVASTPDGRITLESQSGKLWIFDVVGGTSRLEDSLYLPRPDEIRPTKQIVIRISPSDEAALSCKWFLERINTR